MKSISYKLESGFVLGGTHSVLLGFTLCSLISWTIFLATLLPPPLHMPCAFCLHHYCPLSCFGSFNLIFQVLTLMSPTKSFFQSLDEVRTDTRLTP